VEQRKIQVRHRLLNLIPLLRKDVTLHTQRYALQPILQSWVVVIFPSGISRFYYPTPTALIRMEMVLVVKVDEYGSRHQLIIIL
jgi:hypothetical protein